MRCPSCMGKGEVGSGRSAIRNAIGRVREGEIADPKLFERLKALYRDLTRQAPSEEQAVEPVAGPSGPSGNGKRASRGAAKTAVLALPCPEAGCGYVGGTKNALYVHRRRKHAPPVVSATEKVASSRRGSGGPIRGTP